jgi:hypothetical protein
MYQFSGKLKTFSIALVIIGALGIAFSFYSAPKTVEQAKEIIAHQASHGDSHGTSHSDVNKGHKSEQEGEHIHDENGIHAAEKAHNETTSHG